MQQVNTRLSGLNHAAKVGAVLRPIAHMLHGQTHSATTASPNAVSPEHLDAPGIMQLCCVTQQAELNTMFVLLHFPDKHTQVVDKQHSHSHDTMPVV